MADMMGKVAIVTGGSRGIGAAIARRLGRDGFAVVVNYAGNAHEAEQVVAEVGEAVAVQGDVADPAAARRLFDEAEQRFGGVDLLVNNAGIMPPLPSIAATDDETFDRIVAVNLKGSFNMMREAARRLRDGGRIVNLSTSVIAMGRPGYGPYAATKAGVEAMTLVLAREMRGRSISVNAVAPGPTATELFFNGKSDEQVEGLAKAAPLERLGTPEDIAAAIAFLAGQDGGWINGQVIRANGGIV